MGNTAGTVLDSLCGLVVVRPLLITLAVWSVLVLLVGLVWSVSGLTLVWSVSVSGVTLVWALPKKRLICQPCLASSGAQLLIFLVTDASVFKYIGYFHLR